MPLKKSLPQPGEATDLVWLQTSFIGDLVLTTAAMAIARDTWPNIRQHVITTKTGAQVFAGFAGLSSMLVFDKGRRNLFSAAMDLRRQLAALREAPGRQAVLLKAHNSARSSLLAWALGLPVIGYEEADLAMLADYRVPRVAVWHEARRLALLLEPLGVPREKLALARPQLTPLPLTAAVPGAQAAWQSLLSGATAPVIGMAPGSVWGTKRWLPERFAALSGRLLREAKATLVLLGSPGEAALIAEIIAAVPMPERASMIDLSGQTSLNDLRQIFPRLQLLIANDSSPVHYATAFSVPTLAVFGATVPAMGFGPLAPGSRTLEVQLACRPCGAHGPQSCPLGHFRCMRELSADAVYAACLEMLAASEKSR